MTQDLPSAEDYAAERARCAPLAIVDLQALQREVAEPYRNQVVLNFNGECMRQSVFEGEYRWHRHSGTDELFLVVSGELHIEFEGMPAVVLREWQCLVVPAGTVHRTRAVGRTVNLTFEQQGAETEFVEPPPPSSLEPMPLPGDAEFKR
ncbi:cupin domain-containing protein [Luteimonas deserti]|uniref:Cupin domain-containing protein n=1 Tax=Luteimonas deserti TaxID=2752306 RepID=A0A7Z0QRH0_9GAMM|nr:cupin domain-containing protein [Luteimonas deserti]NYZ63489.1 cupin domain-containing protein [Luteimonas deserti]